MKLIYALLLFFISLSINAQIGIDNPTPNPFAILDMKSTNKGVLLPRMTTNNRLALKTSCIGGGGCPDGLLVFDTDNKGFYFFSANDWYLINPFVSPDLDVLNKEESSMNQALVNVAKFYNTNAAGKSLEVGGKSDFKDSISVIGDAYASNRMKANNGFTSANGGVTVKNNVQITETGQYFSHPGYSSNVAATNVAGPVPKGGIIMWSGDPANVPAGWAVCNGSNGTPDLRGRFVIGNGAKTESNRNNVGNVINGANVTYTVGSIGGHEKIQQTSGEMFNHNHNITHNHVLTDPGHFHDFPLGDSGNSCTRADDTGGFECNTNTNSKQTGITIAAFTGNSLNTGGTDYAPNLPPYYVLAYIMKL
jgi:microcystin-dependent protein